MNLSDDDKSFLTRLFGPEIPQGEPLLRSLEPARTVSWSGDVAAPAIENLVQSFIYQGSAQTIIGWTLQCEDSGMQTLSVMAVKATAVAA